MPAGVMLSYGLCSECPDQLNCMKRVQSIKKSVDENGRFALHAFFYSREQRAKRTCLHAVDFYVSRMIADRNQRKGEWLHEYK